MPKQTFHINRFEGGMNTDFAPEDLPDNSLLDALGVSVSRIGRVTMPGNPHLSQHSTIVPNVDTADNPGYGLFSYSSDYFSDNMESPTEYLALQNGSAIQIFNGVAWGADSFGFDMGANDTASATEPSYYAPNGDLRVCDGKFEHLNNFDNNTKWFGYVPKKIIGTGTGAANIGGWQVANAGIEGGYPKSASGVAINAYMADNESSAKGGGGTAYNSENQRYGYVPGTIDWGLQLAYIPASDSLTNASLGDSTWMPTTDVNYKFYASYLYNDGQEGNPTPLRMYPTLRGYLDGKIGSESSGDAEVTSTKTIQFVDRANDGNDTTIDVGIANFSRSGTTVTVTCKFLDATMVTTGSDGTITHTAFASTGEGILIGQHISGTYIPANSVVKSITSTTEFELGDSDGDAVTATGSGTASDGAIGRQHSLAVGNKVIVNGTDNFDGTWEVTAVSGTPGNTFEFTHTTSGTINDTSTEQGYFSKVGTKQAVYFGVGLKYNHDADRDFIFGASTVAASSGGNQRIIGSRVYWSSSEDGHADLWIMFEAHFEKGLKAYGMGKDTPTVTDYMSWSNTNDNQDDLSIDFKAEGFDSNVWKHPPKYETYESLNGYSHNSKLDAKWKTAVIANGRAYIGNVKRRGKSTFNINDTAISSGSQEWGRELVGGSATSDVSNQLNDSGETFITKGVQVGDIVENRTDSTAGFVGRIGSETQLYIENAAGADLDLFPDGDEDYKIYSTSTEPTFGDRILKSPVDRFDTFPEEMAVELFGGDDGDQIIKLETFADRLFVFKKNTLHIVNIAKDVEILESSHKGMGLDGGLPCQSCITSSGIAWMNSSGVYHYNGKEISSLTDNKIELFWKGGLKSHTDGSYTAFWMSNASDSPSIGFDISSNKLIIHKTSTDGGSDKESVLIFDMKIQAWTWLNEALENEDRTNMCHYKGKLIYHEDDASGVSPVYAYSDAPHPPGLNDLTVGDAMSLITKPFDFGTPFQRKKIYKVYITYRTDDAASNVHVQYYVNGIQSYKNFDANATNPFGAADNITMVSNVAELDNTANIWTTAVLKPATSSEANNIKSFGLKFFNEASNNVNFGFEINDITIVYRNKSVK